MEEDGKMGEGLDDGIFIVGCCEDVDGVIFCVCCNKSCWIWMLDMLLRLYQKPKPTCRVAKLMIAAMKEVEFLAVRYCMQLWPLHMQLYQLVPMTPRTFDGHNPENIYEFIYSYSTTL